MTFFKNLFSIFKKKEEKTISKSIEKEEVMQKKPELFTLEQLYSMNDEYNKDKCQEYIDALNEVLPEFDISTPIRVCHFLAQIIHESGHFKSKVENLNYSFEALRRVFPKYFPNNNVANQYARQPEKIANKVYADRMGNGNEASGDGWKYRGRGLIQITGKNNYKECGKALNIDLLSNPDLILEDPITNIKSACWFWQKNSLNVFADRDDILTITKRINGGTNGLSDREYNLKLCKNILGLD